MCHYPYNISRVKRIKVKNEILTEKFNLRKIINASGVLDVK